MSKLTPTTVILMIAAIGAGVFLYLYYSNKKRLETTPPTGTATSPPTTTETAPPTTQPLVRMAQMVRLVKTPVGFMTTR